MATAAHDAAALLRCPVTHGPLTPLTADQTAEANRRAARGELRRADGGVFDGNIEGGLTPASGRFFYPVQDGIVSLLAGSAVLLKGEESAGEPLRREKRQVRDFYDQTGWQHSPDGPFRDSVRFEDLRPVTEGYRARGERKLLALLPSSGDFLLDAGCGPAQNTRADSFRVRVCIDLSRRALEEARRRHGRRGLYVQTDIAELPLADGSVDAAVCLHVLQHVPPDEQEAAVRELHRVLKPGGRALVVYAWGWHSHLTNIATLPFHLARKFAGLRPGARTGREPLYSGSHGYIWFARKDWGFPLRILCWRSLSTPFLRSYVHDGLGAERLLGLAVRLEERFPRLMGALGHHPLFVIDKTQQAS